MVACIDPGCVIMKTNELKYISPYYNIACDGDMIIM